MKKILLLLAIIILLASCKKNDNNNSNNAPENNLEGTWQISDDNNLNTSQLGLPIYVVFTSDNNLYLLFEDNFEIRDIFYETYEIQDNKLYINDQFGLMNFTITGNTVVVEMPISGETTVNVLFDKVSDVAPNDWVQEIELGNPLFSISTEGKITGLAWTGQKTWISESVIDNNDTLIEIDINSGTILQKISSSNSQLISFGYGNNYLLNGGYSNKISLSDPNTGNLDSSIDFSDYNYFNGICYDGEHIWFSAEYMPDSENKLVKCNFNGDIISSINFPDVDDLTFYNNYLWILIYDRIIKFDTNTLKAITTYKITNFEIENFMNSTAIEFIDGYLWGVKNNKFYKKMIN